MPASALDEIVSATGTRLNFLQFDINCNNDFCMHDCSVNTSFFNDGCVFVPCHRYGEADHPGPFSLGTFNPGQLYNNEDAVMNWGPGIWAGSETSHTKNAYQISRSRFKKAGFNTLWSNPVEAHSHHQGSLRGKASGVAIVASMPMQKYPSAMPEELRSSSRCLDAIVQITPDTSMYLASIYGPTHGVTFYDPWAIMAGIW